MTNSAVRPFYRPVGNEIAVFKSAYEKRLPLMVKGPTGSGKSRFIEAMAYDLGRELITVACHDDTSATDLMGRYLIEGGDTRWQDGPVTRAVRSGAILYLDEVAEAREDVIVILHPLTDYRRQIYIDRTNETLTAPPEFMMVVSFNPGYQRGMKQLKPSTRQRFVGLNFGYPNEALETEIVQAESGVDLATAKKLVRLGSKIRTLQELGLAESASTRLIVDAAKLIAQGLPPRIACDSAIVQPLTDDAAVTESLQDLSALAF